MKEQFEEYNFGTEVLLRIAIANSILTEFRTAGYRLTVRQLYYQMVARGYIENTIQSYKRIVDTMTKARHAGLVDWDAIEDRTRSTMRAPQWDNHVEIARTARDQFRLPRWHRQPNHVEVFIEKEALAGVFQPLVDSLSINITPNRGYSSSSEMYQYAKRIRRKYLNEDRAIHVLYFGDHDPSGLDMDRDIVDRFTLLSGGTPFSFQRLALTYDQIEEYDPPPNPAKLTDSRAGAYVEQYGYESWELDALTPQVLTNLVETAVLALRDDTIYNSILEVEEQMRERLKDFVLDELLFWDENFAAWELAPEHEEDDD